MTQRDERGFTLLELLVAMMLLAIVAGLMVSGGRLMAGLRDGLQERGERMTEAAVAAELLRSRLGDAVFVDIGEAGRTEAAFDGEIRRVRFVALRRDYEAGFPKMAWELAVRRDDGQSRLTARFADFPFDTDDLDDLEWSGERMLLETASELAFAYYGRQDGDRESEWSDEWQQQPALPRAVNLKAARGSSVVPPVLATVRARVPSLCAAVAADGEAVVCTLP